MKFLALGTLLLLTMTASAAKIEGSGIKTQLDIERAFAHPTANVTASSACLTSVSSITGIAAGQSVYDLTTPSNIPGQNTGATTVVGIGTSPCSAGQVKISAVASGSGTGDTIGFGGPLSNLPLTAQVYDSFNSMPLSLSISTGAIGGSGGLTNVVGSVGSPQLVTAGGGVSVTSQTTHGPNLVFVSGNGGAVTVTATPSISACSAAGQYLTLIGGSNSLILQSDTALPGSKLKMASNLTLGMDSTANFVCDAASGNWILTANTTSFLTATGCTITTSGNFKIHTCAPSDTFTVTGGSTNNAEVLMIAGGGGGGGNAGAGGGAGGLIDNTNVTLTTGSYTLSVGTGGAGGNGPGSGAGVQGVNTSFLGLTTVIGGGGGGGGNTNAPTTGGSGGGGCFSGGCTTGAAGTVGQGFAGGTGENGVYSCGGGGGGATTVGQGGSSHFPTLLQGGIGFTTSIRGSSECFAGGGNGGNTGGTQATAQCGGGQGANSPVTGGSATAFGGGGGGGGAGSGNDGGPGFVGAVIIKYQFQ